MLRYFEAGIAELPVKAGYVEAGIPELPVIPRYFEESMPDIPRISGDFKCGSRGTLDVHRYWECGLPLQYPTYPYFQDTRLG